MNFDTERWKLLKICEMNARRSCIPGIQKMAGEIADGHICLSLVYLLIHGRPRVYFRK